MALWITGLFLSVALPTLFLAFLRPRWIIPGIGLNMLVFIILLGLAGLLPFQQVPDQTQASLEQMAQDPEAEQDLKNALEDGRVTLWEYQSLNKTNRNTAQ